MVKDGCNNTEKNKILRLHDEGNESEAIALGMGLTLRIVENMIGFYRPEAEVVEVEVKPKKAKGKKAKDKTAADDFK